MRVAVNDSCFDTWGHIRWCGAAKKAINGKPGQKFLKELEEALLDLPKKELVVDSFKEGEDRVCALGAVGQKRKMDMSYLNECDGDHEFIGEEFGITPTLAWEIIYANDDPYMKRTPEERYEYMLKWVQDRILA